MPFDDYKESVAIYLRKSRMDPDSEDIDETLARHEDTLLKLAKQMDLNIVEIYKEVVSGDGLFTRPEMCRLFCRFLLCMNDIYCFCVVFL